MIKFNRILNRLRFFKFCIWRFVRFFIMDYLLIIIEKLEIIFCIE